MPPDANTSGLFPIAPTPFHPDGRLDEGSIDTLVERYLAAGANGVTVLGIMGEASKLEPEESMQIAARFTDRMGKLPVIIGVSAPGLPVATHAQDSKLHGLSPLQVIRPSSDSWRGVSCVRLVSCFFPNGKETEYNSR